MQDNCAHVSQATVIAYPNDMRGLPERADLPSGSPAYNAEAAKASWSAAMDFLKQVRHRRGSVRRAACTMVRLIASKIPFTVRKW
jgi:hypothetical protein